jgi:hypothetical protein
MSGVWISKCPVPENHPVDVVPKMRDRMGCGLGRSTQRKGGETVTKEVRYIRALFSAIEQLWEWVGERGSAKRIAARQSETTDHRTYAEGSAIAYSNVRLRMRTLFAGLIDFDQEE